MAAALQFLLLPYRNVSCTIGRKFLFSLQNKKEKDPEPTCVHMFCIDLLLRQIERLESDMFLNTLLKFTCKYMCIQEIKEFVIIVVHMTHNSSCTCIIYVFFKQL